MLPYYIFQTRLIRSWQRSRRPTWDRQLIEIVTSRIKSKWFTKKIPILSGLSIAFVAFLQNKSLFFQCNINECEYEWKLPTSIKLLCILGTLWWGMKLAWVAFVLNNLVIVIGMLAYDYDHSNVGLALIGIFASKIQGKTINVMNMDIPWHFL